MKLRNYAVGLSLAAGGLGLALLLEQRTSRELTAQVSRLTRQNAELRYDLKQATQQAETLEKRAVALDNQLGSAKTRTTATESKQVQLSRELYETKTLLTDREQREVALMAELATLREKLGGANTVAATPAVTPPAAAVPTVTAPGSALEPLPPPAPAVDIAPYEHRIVELEQQLTELLTRALAEPAGQTAAEPIPAPPATHQVVRVGARDSFVVLDYGRMQGARPGDFISLHRGTSEVARVQISDARPRFSLARVLPTTLKGQLQPGDFVVLEN